MDRAYLIGSPISQSLSPEIFRFLSLATQTPFAYTAREISSSDLACEFENIKREPHITGLNVTHPHKEKVLTFLNYLSPEARAIGAVNVVRFLDGRAIGHNTDAFGIQKALFHFPVSIARRDCLILGAGGAARAAAYALAEEGASRIDFLNRNTARAEKLIAHFSPLFPRTSFSLGNKTRQAAYSLVIKATPLEAPFSLPFLFPESVFFLDLAYAAKPTPFLSSLPHSAKSDGLSMLIWQALASWELWFSPLPRQNALFENLKNHLEGVLHGTSLSHGG